MLKRLGYRLIPPVEANIQLPISVDEARQRLHGLSGQNLTVEEELGWFGRYTLAYRICAHKVGWRIDERFPWFLGGDFPGRTQVSLSENDTPHIHLVTWPHPGKLLMSLLMMLVCFLFLFIAALPVWVPIFLALLIAGATIIGANTQTSRTALRHKRALLHALGLKLIGDTGEPYRAPYM